MLSNYYHNPASLKKNRDAKAAVAERVAAEEAAALEVEQNARLATQFGAVITGEAAEESNPLDEATGTETAAADEEV